MPVNKHARRGDYVQIPLGDGSFGYGKLLLEPEVAFFDLRTTVEDFQPNELYSASPLFRLWVMKSAFKPSSKWKVVGKQDLTDDELVQHKYFKVDALSGKLEIYHSGAQYSNGYREWSASFAECQGLERAAVWDPEHIEIRLLDHFEGRPNRYVESLKIKLS